jgi:hypothetical protein
LPDRAAGASPRTQQHGGRDHTGRRPVHAEKELDIRLLAITTAAVALLAAAGAAQAEVTASTKGGHSHRFTVVKKLKQGLRGTPLARHAFRFEAEGWRWNINPFLVASIAGVESSFGAAACGANAWGIANCARSFSTFHEGIGYATKLLRTFYLDLGYVTLDSVGARYAACGSCWASKTGWFMRNRFGSSLRLTYPRK